MHGHASSQPARGRDAKVRTRNARRARRRALALCTLSLAARPVIGGQAVIEGVMMRSPKCLAVAVRKPDGGIVVREEAWLSFSERFAFLKWPLLRGANMLVESMYNGLLALSFSAATAFPDDEQARDEHERLQHSKSDGGNAMWLTLAASMAFAIVLFKGLPHLSALGIGHLIARLQGHVGENALPMTGAGFHVVDGIVKLGVFVGYIALISRLPDVKRLFMYHGAEHKSVHVWEAHEPLDVDSARPKTTAHPRCGTSLMLLVIATSVVVFAGVLPLMPVVSSSEWLQALFLFTVKIPLMLPIAGLAYEAQRLAARHPGNVLVRALIAPGMLMQRLTTREPGDAELEVALAALRKAVWRESEGKALAARADATVENFADFAAVREQIKLAA